MFLFHTGTIKSYSVSSQRFGDPEFLFHTGTIKSEESLGDSPDSMLFLFHTGTIKRNATCNPYWLHIQRFYSTLVRLKVRDYIAYLHEVQGFLFHTGTIKRESEFNVAAQDGVFLFHTGTIKSSKVFPFQLFTISCFYSTLVRLKADAFS